MSDEVLERLERASENHPNATAKRLLWLADADPSYLEAAEAIVAGDSPSKSEHDSRNSTRDRGRESHTQLRPDLHARFDEWADADFSDPRSGIWPDELLEREQWMGHREKKPFAPWGNTNAPADCDKDGHDTAAQCDCDARFKWGYRGHYVDGETVAMAEIDPRLDGRAFIQREDDPYVYVDGDDVRCPETGDVHPAFVALLEHLGATYADISQSGAGVHAIYRGDFDNLEDDVKQASWRIDEDPWGENDDLPSIEIYPGKRVCVATGHHVPGTPTEVREWNDDVLEDLLDANDQLPNRRRDEDPDHVSIDRDDYDLEDYEPEATSSNETTDDIRDIFAAIDRLDAQAVAEKTIVQRWNDDATTSDGERAFWPTWGSLSDGGTANIVNSERWQDTGELGGYGGPVSMAAIDAGEVRPANARPVDGETWWRGVDHLRELGFDIPEYEPSSDDAYKGDGNGRAVSALPIGQLDALDPAERRRYAKKRGLEWPSTDAARDKLFETIAEESDALFEVGGGETSTVEWAQPGQRSSTDTPDVVEYEATKRTKRTLKATVVGGRLTVTDEAQTADLSSPVALDERRVVSGSEAIRNADDGQRYRAERDYRLRPGQGELEIREGGDIADGEALTIDYEFKVDGSYAHDDYAGDARTETTEQIPQAATERACEQAAKLIVDKASVPRWEADVQVPAGEDIGSLLGALDLEEIPGDAMSVYSVEETPEGLQLRLGNRQRVSDTIAQIRSQLAATSERV